MTPPSNGKARRVLDVSLNRLLQRPPDASAALRLIGLGLLLVLVAIATIFSTGPYAFLILIWAWSCLTRGLRRFVPLPVALPIGFVATALLFVLPAVIW